jgi:hypothetical protein
MKYLYVIAAAFVMSCTFCQAQDKKPPNFVILFIDDMGWRDWSGNGSDYIKTPTIDAIAKEGLVFQQGYVNAANCAPSRCAILSGQYPQRNDFYNVFTIHRGIKHVDRLSLKDIQDGQTLRSNKRTVCLLKYFFTHFEFPFYIFRRTFVSKFGFPSNCLEVIQNFVESRMDMPAFVRL